MTQTVGQAMEGEKYSTVELVTSNKIFSSLRNGIGNVRTFSLDFTSGSAFSDPDSSARVEDVIEEVQSALLQEFAVHVQRCVLRPRLSKRKSWFWACRDHHV